MKKILKKQDPPTCIFFEITEGCNLRCSFCGLNGIRGDMAKDNEYVYMSMEHVKELANRIADTGWTTRLEIASRGEPTLHPDFPKIIHILRKKLPHNFMIMLSNGVGFLKDPNRLVEVFQAGLNNLGLEDYMHVSIAPKLREKVYTEDFMQRLKDERVKVFEYPKEDDGNPHQHASFRKLSFIEDISVSSKGNHLHVCNHAGSAGPKNDHMQGKRCARPFREIVLRMDGQVPLCCQDWRGEFRVGNALDTPLQELWQGPILWAARRKLLRGERDFSVCSGCDSVSFRVGLLPDRMGKFTLDEATKEDEKILKKAGSIVPMTKPRLRPWELVQIEEKK